MLIATPQGVHPTAAHLQPEATETVHVAWDDAASVL